MRKLLKKMLLAVAATASVVGCSALPDESASREAQCRALIERVDRHAGNRGVGDAEAAKVDGYPYLRINRFLASFREELDGEGAFPEWVRRLRALDSEARQVEMQNLGAPGALGAVEACAETLLAADMKRNGFRKELIAAARPPRHYDDGARAAGLYPLTHLGVAMGFAGWKADNLPSFDDVPGAGAEREVRYALPPDAGLLPDDGAALIALSANNALGIPDLDGGVLDQFARRFAPVFAVAEQSGADRIGRPYWPAGLTDAPRTDLDDPVVYVRLAHTRFEGEVLPQIVYTVWFPARPRDGTFDVLGGALDGLVWRVTLGRDGRPLIYDTFHACGCYHMFFPVAPVRRQPVAEDGDLREEPLAPRGAPDLVPGERLTVHLASASHYITSLSVTADADTDVLLRPVDEHQGPVFGLRSLALEEGGRRSLFGPDGIVPGTERGERFFLWPMGIASAGAMRQWGTHATAFSGERHADDPFLFDEAFAR